jgi:hypothetical protein
MRSDLDDEQECGFDRDRHALAQLLLSRNCQMAAKVVAVSRYRTTYVADSYYCVLLSVPPELYDTARADPSDVLSAACAADIVGPDAFHSLKSQVSRPPYESRGSRKPSRQGMRSGSASERLDARELRRHAS